MFQAVETEYTSAITVILNFQKRAILRHLEKVNRDNGSQEDPGVVNIVFKCPDCNQNYFNKRSLNRHQKNDHDKARSVYNCSSRAKTFNTGQTTSAV